MAAGVTGIILCGGRSRRMGFHKALAEVGGVPLWQRAVEAVAAVAAEVLVVGAAFDPCVQEPCGIRVRRVPDLVESEGPLVGIYSGLKSSGTPINVVVACDMPFVNPQVVRHLVRLAEVNDVDAVVPVIDGKPQPTYAVYERTCLDAIRGSLDEAETSPLRVIRRVRSLLVPQDEIEQIDPSLLSFFNVNTPSDLSRARLLAGEIDGNYGS